MPPPSPHTKPSRPASNGRDAFCGSSLRVDIAFIEQKPAMVSGTTMASAPPAIITSASPRWIRRKASPSAWLPVAQAVTTAEFGPLAPKRIETSPDAMLTMRIGMKNGETRSGPFSMSILCASRSEEMAPMPVTTTRRGSTALRVVLDVLDGVATGHDLLGVLVRDLDVEVLLQGHDELDGIEGVGAQVFDELRGRSDVVLLHPELLDDDLLHLILD